MKDARPELENLQVGDVALINEYTYGAAQLFLAKVTKRTPTRITVTHQGRESTWTLSGDAYPAHRGYGYHRNLLPANEEYLETYRRSRELRRITSYVYKLSKHMRVPGKGVALLSEQQLRGLADTLEACLLTLSEEINLNEAD